MPEINEILAKASELYSGVYEFDGTQILLALCFVLILYVNVRLRAIRLIVKEHMRQIHVLASEDHAAPPPEELIKSWKHCYKQEKRGTARWKAYRAKLKQHNLLDE